MGFFSNIFKQGKDLTSAANAVANVRGLLDRYEIDPDFMSYLCVAAWITRVGFLDVAERNQWYPIYTIYVPINGQPVRMTIAEATAQTMGRILMKSSQLSQEEQDFIQDIFDKGRAFCIIESQLPDNVVQMFKKYNTE